MGKGVLEEAGRNVANLSVPTFPPFADSASQLHMPAIGQLSATCEKRSGQAGWSVVTVLSFEEMQTVAVKTVAVTE